jgi:hypothetical protein
MFSGFNNLAEWLLMDVLQEVQIDFLEMLADGGWPLRVTLFRRKYTCLKYWLMGVGR